MTAGWQRLVAFAPERSAALDAHRIGHLDKAKMIAFYLMELPVFGG
jgi:hypothetical protein